MSFHNIFSVTLNWSLFFVCFAGYRQLRTRPLLVDIKMASKSELYHCSQLLNKESCYWLPKKQEGRYWLSNKEEGRYWLSNLHSS